MPDSNLSKRVFSERLVAVADKVRRKIHTKLGTRPWKVEIVRRSWDGGRRGVGTATDTVIELDPVPQVSRVSKDRMGPAGREESGNIVLTRVSLTYTEGELDPRAGQGVEYAYRLTDLHGTQSKPRWFVLAASPVARWGDKPGDNTDWYVLLNETSALPDLGGVNA